MHWKESLKILALAFVALVMLFYDQESPDKWWYGGPPLNEISCLRTFPNGEILDWMDDRICHWVKQPAISIWNFFSVPVRRAIVVIVAIIGAGAIKDAASALIGSWAAKRKKEHDEWRENMKK